MKRTLLTLLCVMATFLAGAQTMDFTDNLVVTINGISTEPQKATVTLSLNENGTCNFFLPNFVLADGENEMPVGNIVINDIPVEMSDGYITFTYEDKLLIQEGDKEGVDMWLGPMLGEIPLKLQGKATMQSLHVTIDIDMMDTLGQVIYVEFGGNGDDPNAQAFTDKLVVTINDISSEPQETTVYLSLNEDNTLNFLLPNFVLSDGENDMPVGNIVINNIPFEMCDDYITFSYEDKLLIQEGDKAGVDMWLGPMLGEIPLKLQGKATMDALHVTIDIDMMDTLGQVIYVEFGSDGDDPNAQAFTDKLVVTINEISSEPQETTVYLSLNEDNTLNFLLPNFVLSDGENDMPVGNIIINNIPFEMCDDYITFSYEDKLLIQEGDKAGVDMWLGPMLGEIPLKLQGKATMDALHVTIDIDMMDTLGQVIYVEFGQEFKDDDEDAICGVVKATTGSATIYDLMGRRVQNAGRGLYIINGKKVVK